MAALKSEGFIPGNASVLLCLVLVFGGFCLPLTRGTNQVTLFLCAASLVGFGIPISLVAQTEAILPYDPMLHRFAAYATR